MGFGVEELVASWLKTQRVSASVLRLSIVCLRALSHSQSAATLSLSHFLLSVRMNGEGQGQGKRED